MGILSRISQLHQQTFCQQWLTEATDARAGAEWFAPWPPVCRGMWAESMQAVAQDGGFLRSASLEIRIWLISLAARSQTTENRKDR